MDNISTLSSVYHIPSHMLKRKCDINILNKGLSSLDDDNGFDDLENIKAEFKNAANIGNLLDLDFDTNPITNIETNSNIIGDLLGSLDLEEQNPHSGIVNFSEPIFVSKQTSFSFEKQNVLTSDNCDGLEVNVFNLFNF